VSIATHVLPQHLSAHGNGVNDTANPFLAVRTCEPNSAHDGCMSVPHLSWRVTLYFYSTPGL